MMKSVKSNSSASNLFLFFVMKPGQVLKQLLCVGDLLKRLIVAERSGHDQASVFFPQTPDQMDWMGGVSSVFSMDHVF